MVRLRGSSRRVTVRVEDHRTTSFKSPTSFSQTATDMSSPRPPRTLIGGDDTSQPEYEDSITYRDDTVPNDEGYSDLDTASTTPYTAEDEEFQYQFDRRYQGSHWEPNDGKRQEMWDNTAFADEHPDVRVIGIDMSPIAPNLPNRRLQPPVDFRGILLWLYTCSGSEWKYRSPKFTKEVFKALAPGGVAEFHERPIGINITKGPLTENSHLYQWGEFFRQAGEKRGRPFLVEADGALRQAMETAGFERIEEYMYEIPIGEWTESDDLKSLGKFALMDFNYDVEGSMLRLATEVLG
ncbi:uncharacterized protein FTOL_08650 [Fusarium torulosum]|uniref:Methyltransferase n=1 Tax=Fusarium torulosum TaxID=33205 RepID=A0AAE8SK60_9HYPO|nr:uncharacterized protein FTOL_08650 [Fusarium torulosum]